MILKAKYDRVICWGCTVGVSDIQVGLVYIDSNISTPTITLISKKGDAYDATLPEEFLSNPMPTKATNIILHRRNYDPSNSQ